MKIINLVLYPLHIDRLDPILHHGILYSHKYLSSQLIAVLKIHVEFDW